MPNKEVKKEKKRLLTPVTTFHLMAKKNDKLKKLLDEFKLKPI